MKTFKFTMEIEVQAESGADAYIQAEELKQKFNLVAQGALVVPAWNPDDAESIHHDWEY